MREIQAGESAAGAAQAHPGKRFLDQAFTRWLADPDITIVCGRWDDEGAIAELMPQGRGYLLPARYPAPFTGVRELRLADSPHHLHIDFDRVQRLQYVVAPSVCLAFRPSFEVRLLLGGPDAKRWLVSLMLAAPYRDGQLDHDAVLRFFDRARSDAIEAPGLVELKIEPVARTGEQGAAILALLDIAGRRAAPPEPASPTAPTAPDCDEDLWAVATQRLVPPPRPLPVRAPPDPACRPLLERALALVDASLVIYRHQLLVEFQTEQLGGLQRYEEQGHVSWQIGDTRKHHCHLSLAAVARVLFSAEPVSCQGGGLNYTVWFLSAEDCGNPWRSDGYFSVVLNRPYQGDRPRAEVITPMLALYQAFCDERWVQADETFLRVLREGPPERRVASGQGGSFD